MNADVDALQISSTVAYDLANLPTTCRCTKISYPDEETARAAAARQSDVFDTRFRVYRCPGHNVWHTTSSGFAVDALHTLNRIMAYHIWSRRVLDVAWLRGVCHADGTSRNRRLKFGQTMTAFHRLGFIADEPAGHNAPHRVRATDDDGLLRVMEVGLTYLITERGIVRAAPQPKAPTSPTHAEMPADADLRRTCARVLVALTLADRPSDGETDRVPRAALRAQVEDALAHRGPVDRDAIKQSLRWFEGQSWARRDGADTVIVLDPAALHLVAHGREDAAVGASPNSTTGIDTDTDTDTDTDSTRVR